MKKILLYILGFFIIIQNVFGTLQEQIIPTEETAIVDNQVDINGDSIFLLEYIKESIFGLLAFIAIAVFIFIGARLVMARGNPEEFKKAIMQFIYAIVGLAIVALSWGAVKLIGSLNF